MPISAPPGVTKHRYLEDADVKTGIGFHGVGADYIARTSVDDLDLAVHASRHVDGGADEITSALDLGAIPSIHKVYEDSLLSASTTSTSYVDTGATLTITTGDSTLLLIFTGGGQNTGTYLKYLRFNIDGSGLAWALEFSDDGYRVQNITMVRQKSVAAGTHTIKVQFKTGGGTFKITETHLIVIELTK